MKKDIYIKSFFDENAKIYGERYLRLDTPRDILFSRRKSILISLIKELQIFPKSLADLGCGSGEITEAIMSLKNNHKEFNKILLVDSSKNMLEISNERIRNKFPKSNVAVPLCTSSSKSKICIGFDSRNFFTSVLWLFLEAEILHIQ